MGNFSVSAHIYVGAVVWTVRDTGRRRLRWGRYLASVVAAVMVPVLRTWLASSQPGGWRGVHSELREARAAGEVTPAVLHVAKKFDCVHVRPPALRSQTGILDMPRSR